jgi:hypothetical protein
VGQSDLFRVTRWAVALERAPVRLWPSLRSRSPFSLRLLAEDHTSEVYVVLSTWRDPNGREWARIRMPGRRGSRSGWVPRVALGRLGVSHAAIRINRRLLRLTAYDSGRRVFRVPIGIGAPGTPTPRGQYWVRQRLRMTPGGIFGAMVLTTSAYAPTLSDWPAGGIVGIHGTNRPDLIPGRPSHGCVRLVDRDALRLYRLVSTGTPIEIV